MLRKLVLGGALLVAWVSACGTKKGDEFASCKPGEGYCACRSDGTCSDGFVCSQHHECIRDDGAAGAPGDAGRGAGGSGGAGSGGKAGPDSGGSKSTGGSNGHRGGSGGKGEKGGTSGGGDAGSGEPVPSTGGSSRGGTGNDTGAGSAGEAGQAGASGDGQGGESGAGGTLNTGGTAGGVSTGGTPSTGGMPSTGGTAGDVSAGGSGGTPATGGMSGAGAVGGLAGSTSAGAGGQGGQGHDCVEITRGEVAFTDLGNAPHAAIYAFHADATHAKTPLGDADTVDYLEVQFYASTFNPIDNGEATGTFELGTGIDENFETCARCLLIDEDVPDQGKPKALYFATEGTMTVADTSQQMTGAPNLTLSKVTFREVLIDETTNESTLVPDGRCVYLESASLD